MFIYRDEYYQERRKPPDGTPEFAEWQQRMEIVHGVAEIIIGKHRHGPTATVELSFDGARTKFANLERRHAADAPPF